MAAAAELNISAGNTGPIQGSGGGEGAGVPRDEAVISKIQEKLLTMNEEKGGQADVATLQQEENVSISGSNARLMIMKKLSRKSEVWVGWWGGGRGEVCVGGEGGGRVTAVAGSYTGYSLSSQVWWCCATWYQQRI